MKEGDCCDTVEILSTAERDYLLRNNADRVEIESLRGKTICIYFLHSLGLDSDRELYIDLAEVYNELSPKGEFEVVVVAARGVVSPKDKKRKIDLTEERKRKTNYGRLLQDIYSVTPWLSIPYEDVKARKYLCNLFSISQLCSECVILDPDGKVVSNEGSIILHEYGAEGYPFTAERIRVIRKEDKLLRRNLCLKTLLGFSTRDFVITNENNQVPTSKLLGKVVGLYMYHDSRVVKQQLLAAFKKLKEDKKEFEIVLVNLHFNYGCSDLNSFWQVFGEMPWYALPFMDKRCRKLWRIFNCPCVDYDEGILLIFGSDGNFLETYGYTILEGYGTDAFPFTKEKMVEIETNKRKEEFKEATFDRLFAMAAIDYVIKRDKTEIALSDLKGKNILLFAPLIDGKGQCKVLSKLLEWYYEIKEKDATFEVVYVSRTRCPVSFDEIFSEMPWLAFPPKSQALRACYHIFCGVVPELAAFGVDGHLVTKVALSRLQDHGVNAYPFTEDDVTEDILLMPCTV